MGYFHFCYPKVASNASIVLGPTGKNTAPNDWGFILWDSAADRLGPRNCRWRYLCCLAVVKNLRRRPQWQYPLRNQAYSVRCSYWHPVPALILLIISIKTLVCGSDIPADLAVPSKGEARLIVGVALGRHLEGIELGEESFLNGAQLIASG